MWKANPAADWGAYHHAFHDARMTTWEWHTPPKRWVCFYLGAYRKPKRWARK